jgi:uncharacterized protein with HEPN domain
MTEPTLLQYLEHMQEYGLEAIGFARGLSMEQLAADKKSLYAVLNALQSIGEAAGRLSQRYPQFAAKHPEVPWRQMQGMRNRLAHGYFDVKVEIVWKVVTDDLPRIEQALPEVRKDAEAYLRSQGPGR